MRLIATRQTHSKEFGTVVAGQEVEVSEETGKALLRGGIMRKPEPPTILYETKVIVPEAPEVSARQPFRDLPVSHSEPKGLAPESDSVLPGADLSEPGVTDPSRRGRRARSGPKR